MYKNLLFLFLLSLCFPLAAQQWTWASDVGRYFITQSQLRVKTNDAGDLFTAGTFSGRVTLGDTTFFKDTSYYAYHAEYLARLTSENNLIWAQLIDGTHTLLYDMTVDDHNCIFAVGYYESDLILADTVLHDGPKNFLVSYTGSGTRRWIKTFAKSWTWNDKLVIDHDRNIVYEYDALDSMVVEKRDGGTGALLWRKSFFIYAPTSMCVDSRNNILMAIPWGADTFRIAGRSYQPAYNYGQFTYVVTLDAAGSLSNVERMCGALRVKIACDGSDNICALGYYRKKMKLRDREITGNDYEAPFVAKLNTRNVCSWIKASGAPGTWLMAMDVAPAGDIYCAGVFTDTLKFKGFNLAEQNARYALYVLKIDKDGNALWAFKNGGGDGSDASPYSMAVNEHEDIVLAGSYHTYMSAEWFGDDTLANTSFHENIFLARADGTKLNNVANLIFSDSEMNIYPNPCNGNFALALPKEWERGTLLIYDALGNVCLKKDFSNGISGISASLCTGLYLVEVSNGEKRFCKKLMVE